MGMPRKAETDSEMRGFLGEIAKGATSEEVNVEVEDGLTGVGTLIDDQTVAFKAELFANDSSGVEQVSVITGFFDKSHAGDFGAGNDEDMNRGFGLDIAKGDAEIIFINDIGGDFAIDDLGEDRGHERF